jgi:hypothetical protein
MTTGDSDRQEKIMEFAQPGLEGMPVEIQLRPSSPRQGLITHAVLRRLASLPATPELEG